MSQHPPRLSHVAPAAMVIGGLLVFALPWYGLSLLRVVVASVAAAAALRALMAAVPEWSGAVWWSSPFGRRMSFAPDGEPEGFRELARIKKALARTRRPIGAAPPMPPDAVRLLQPLIRTALERQGFETDAVEAAGTARDVVEPLTWAVLTADLKTHVPWYRRSRPAVGRVAEVVHAVLDDLDRLAQDGAEVQVSDRTASTETI